MTPLQENILFLKTIEKRLDSGGVLSPQAEAEDLVRHFGRIGRVDFFAGEKTLRRSAKKKIDWALRTRLKGTPLSYILKERSFSGLDFFISPDVLIPRPETEVLLEEALKILNTYYKCHPRARQIDGPTVFLAGAGMTANGPEILEIGTGSGCIAVSLTCERPDCRMTALDISSAALRIARKNLYLHGLQKKIRLVKSDLFGAFYLRRKESWDVIVSNPPYVPEEDIPGLPREVRKEPRLALDGGHEGTRVIDSILEQAPGFLKEGGWLLMEIGAGQSEVLRENILRNKKYKNLSFIKDATGINRVLRVQKE
ncbi:MAG: protein-(glutamine-N5) methyltransferase, release factor-specific [Omnitrophica bacterium RIFCSPHIGHO2_02_FULL_51_18]|nr:MAG: protein-(glutamine-N5) methyltransferase, release factor-specific [Omnitrophica bacterium RIFCSPHIGHO2_02_FULL_51_18]